MGLERDTHDFAVKIVLLDHDGVYGPWVFEGEEAKTTRASALAVAHHGALKDFSKLREIVAQ